MQCLRFSALKLPPRSPPPHKSNFCTLCLFFLHCQGIYLVQLTKCILVYFDAQVTFLLFVFILVILLLLPGIWHLGYQEKSTFLTPAASHYCHFLIHLVSLVCPPACYRPSPPLFKSLSPVFVVLSPTRSPLSCQVFDHLLCAVTLTSKYWFCPLLCFHRLCCSSLTTEAEGVSAIPPPFSHPFTLPYLIL